MNFASLLLMLTFVLRERVDGQVFKEHASLSEQHVDAWYLNYFSYHCSSIKLSLVFCLKKVEWNGYKLSGSGVGLFTVNAILDAQGNN